MHGLRIAAAALVLLASNVAEARARRGSSQSGSRSSGSVSVRGHTTKRGAFVPAHTRTAPNKTKNDNWGTRGNVNPRTGKGGTQPRDGER